MTLLPELGRGIFEVHDRNPPAIMRLGSRQSGDGKITFLTSPCNELRRARHISEVVSWNRLVAH